MHLQLQHNQLFKLFEQNQHWLPNRLAQLNVSHNQISQFPSGGLFAELVELDIGYNLLTSVPGMLSDQAPALRRLVLDGNPIAQVHFNGSLTLEHLSISHMPLMREMAVDSMLNLGKTMNAQL